MKRINCLLILSFLFCAPWNRTHAQSCTVRAQASNFSFTPHGSPDPGAPLGDGCDETVTWEFDFSGTRDGNFLNELPNLGGLDAAMLSLTLGEGAEHMQDPSECEMGGDEVWLDGGARMPAFNEDEYFTHTLDMLATYSSSQIISALNSGDGKLIMHYENDAKVTRSSLVLTFSDCSCANVAEAQWNQPGGGAFSDDANWLDLETPDEFASVAFDVGGTYTVSFSESVVNNALRVTSGAQPTLALAGNTYALNRQCGAGAAVTVEAASELGIDGGTVNANGDVLLDGIGVLLGINDQAMLSAMGNVRLNVGVAEGIFVNDGGRLNATDDVIAGEESGRAGLVALTGPGAAFTTSGRLVLGEGGQGELSVSEGVAEVNELILSEQSNSKGTLRVTNDGTVTVMGAASLAVGSSTNAEVELSGTSGQQSTLTLEQGAEIAGRGEANVEVGAHSLFSCASITCKVEVGTSRGARGTITATGERAEIEIETLTLGIQGIGALELNDRAQAFLGTLSTGEQTEGEGTISVTGAMTALTAETAVVGDGNLGELELKDQAQADFTTLTAGAVIGSDGLISVTGAMTALTAETAVVGDEGIGKLEIKEQATARIRDLTVSTKVGAGGPDEVTVTKATLEVGFARIGVAGQAVLSIEDLSDLKADIVNLGFEENGSGTLEVKGPGAMAELDALVVGNKGTGGLAITDGATLQALDVIAGLQGGFGDISIQGAGSSLNVAGTLCLGCQSSALANLFLGGGSFATIGTLHQGAQSTVDPSGGTLNVGQTIPAAAEEGSANKIEQDTPVITVDTLLATAGATILVDTVNIYPGGVLAGDYDWPFLITNAGTIAPGDSVGAAGTFTAAAGYAQTAEGTLEIELGGTDEGTYDRLDVTGTAALGGTLRVHLVQDFVPRAGQTFEIVRADSIAGSFDEVVMPSSVAFDVVYEPTRVVLTVLTVTSVAEEEADEEAGVPSSFVLAQNYPNPFNPQTTIGYALPRSERVRLVVFDGLGREVAVLVEGMQGPGHHEVVFDAGALPSGVYLYRLEAGAHTQTRRLTLLK